MNGKLLDTNVIIRYIKNEGNLDDIFEERDLYFSSITLGELLFGAECSARKAENAAVYAGFCNELEEIKADASVAPAYAKIKAQLKADGHPIPENQHTPTQSIGVCRSHKVSPSGFIPFIATQSVGVSNPPHE